MRRRYCIDLSLIDIAAYFYEFISTYLSMGDKSGPMCAISDSVLNCLQVDTRGDSQKLALGARTVRKSQ